MENSGETFVNSLKIDKALQNILQDHDWQQGEIGFNVLQNSSHSNIVLVALHKDSEFESFQANNSLVIKLISGKIKLRLNAGTYILEPGHWVVLTDNMHYLIEALEESAFLLTTNDDYLQKNNWIC